MFNIRKYSRYILNDIKNFFKYVLNYHDDTIVEINNIIMIIGQIFFYYKSLRGKIRYDILTLQLPLSYVVYKNLRSKIKKYIEFRRKVLIARSNLKAICGCANSAELFKKAKYMNNDELTCLFDLYGNYSLNYGMTVEAININATSDHLLIICKYDNRILKPISDQYKLTKEDFFKYGNMFTINAGTAEKYLNSKSTIKQQIIPYDVNYSPSYNLRKMLDFKKKIYEMWLSKIQRRFLARFYTPYIDEGMLQCRYVKSCSKYEMFGCYSENL